MNKLYLNKREQKHLTALVATIGFFDGVHRGHQFLIENVKRIAKQAGMQSAVITFDLHPRQVLHPDQSPSLLSSLNQKLAHIEATGIDNCIVLHFDKALSQLSAKEFMQTILKEQLNVQKLVIGYDNKFGHNRTEGFEDYQRYGKKLGIEVVENMELDTADEHISSSVVRKHIKNGEIKAANHDLGYIYTLEGKIVTGFQNGHKLGYPTANMDPKTCLQLLPADGVYAVKVKTNLSETWFDGMLYIGVRPTYNGNALCIETNIFNFDKELYGHNIKLALIDRVRDDKKFESLEALSLQLGEDKLKCEEILKDESSKNHS